MRLDQIGPRLDQISRSLEGLASTLQSVWGTADRLSAEMKEIRSAEVQLGLTADKHHEAPAKPVKP